MQQVLDIPILAPSKVNGDVPADFDPIALRALERDPGKRYPTAKAMAAEIEEVLRKHGYAAKNDRIARYMQATFAAHIAARKKLLQEVSSKGRPSQDVLEAAFNLGALASGSPVLAANDPWSRRLRIDRREPSAGGGDPDGSAGGAGVLPRGIDDSSAERPPPPRPAVAAGEAPAPAMAPAMIERPAPATPEATPPAAVATGSDGPTEVERSAMRARRRWTPYAIGAAAAVLIGSVVGAVVVRAREDTAEHSTLFDTAPATAAPAATATEDPPAAVEARTQPVQGAEHLPIVIVHADDPGAGSAAPGDDGITLEPAAKPARSRHVQATRSAQAKPAPERGNPEELVKEGLQSLVRGDPRAALALCKRATQANPSHAPGWRLMGLVYEKLGEKASAHSAYQKYLQLAPGASDAPSIRQHLESL
ncbi:MAG: tetratricopeptide repeat protein [Deltaproteobacteria bacterium]|nr:MAG: tetratricopeptide repeat protein [Deltaproteobacteria bacterium]